MQLEIGGAWDLDEPLPSVRRRLARAAGVAGVWAVSALPIALGWQKCAIATLIHRPCPGCGMTRAIHLLQAGQLDASLRLQPLAVPVLAVGLLFIFSTVWTTLRLGTPLHVHKSRLARVTLGIAAVVYGAAFALWMLRWFGYFGGPVPVS
ncbi:MAG TPA: DUF2752 domain-containing protein [Polyangiaceae bacterium]